MDAVALPILKDPNQLKNSGLLGWGIPYGNGGSPWASPWHSPPSSNDCSPKSSPSTANSHPKKRFSTAVSKVLVLDSSVDNVRTLIPPTTRDLATLDEDDSPISPQIGWPSSVYGPPRPATNSSPGFSARKGRRVSEITIPQSNFQCVASPFQGLPYQLNFGLLNCSLRSEPYLQAVECRNDFGRSTSTLSSVPPHGANNDVQSQMRAKLLADLFESKHAPPLAAFGPTRGSDVSSVPKSPVAMRQSLLLSSADPLQSATPTTVKPNFLQPAGCSLPYPSSTAHPNLPSLTLRMIHDRSPLMGDSAVLPSSHFGASSARQVSTGLDHRTSSLSSTGAEFGTLFEPFRQSTTAGDSFSGGLSQKARQTCLQIPELAFISGLAASNRATQRKFDQKTTTVYSRPFPTDILESLSSDRSSVEGMAWFRPKFLHYAMMLYYYIFKAFALLDVVRKMRWQDTPLEATLREVIRNEWQLAISQKRRYHAWICSRTADAKTVFVERDYCAIFFCSGRRDTSRSRGEIGFCSEHAELCDAHLQRHRRDEYRLIACVLVDNSGHDHLTCAYGAFFSKARSLYGFDFQMLTGVNMLESLVRELAEVSKQRTSSSVVDD